ncbi:MAG: hypothetical protein AAGK97_18170, partial [Bacteroidota bacterium]
DSLVGEIQFCDDSISVSLLIKENCRIEGDTITLESCPGDTTVYVDSTWIGLGLFEHHFISAAGCDSIQFVEIVAQDSGLISFVTLFDLDQSNDIDPGDTLLPNIDLIILNLNSGEEINLTSGTNGLNSLALPGGDYMLLVNRGLLDTILIPIIDSLPFSIDPCGIGQGDPLQILIGMDCQPLSVTEDYTICNGDSIFLYGTWYSDVVNFDTTFYDSSNCAIVVNVNVGVTEGPEIMSVVNTFCDSSGVQGEVLLLVNGNGPFTFDWTPNVSSDSIATNLPVGTYVVEVTDQLGCSSFDTIIIESNGFVLEAIVNTICDSTGTNGEIILLVDGEGPFTYVWEPNVSND